MGKKERKFDGGEVCAWGDEGTGKACFAVNSHGKTWRAANVGMDTLYDYNTTFLGVVGRMGANVEVRACGVGTQPNFGQ